MSAATQQSINEMFRTIYNDEYIIRHVLPDTALFDDYIVWHKPKKLGIVTSIDDDVPEYLRVSEGL